MTDKLKIDQDLVRRARESAESIADGVMALITPKTTVSVERTVGRLLGIDGVNGEGVPLVNVLVDNLLEKGVLSHGLTYWIVNGCEQLGLTPQKLAEEVSSGRLDLTALKPLPVHSLKDKMEEYAQRGLDRIRKRVEERRKFIQRLGKGKAPELYVIVATGNIYEDVIQAQTAARNGADIIAVIRTTGQSLLDYVPYGATTEGFGGTYATQENFRIMRKALDEVSEEVGRYIQLVNYCSGLCMPEIAAMGAMERLDMMLNDALYGILFRDINMQRTLIDQNFSRIINGFAEIIINTGEDNYLTTADAIEEGHTVIASQFINEKLGLLAGLKPQQLGLGHAFEINPDVENGLLYEIAQAQLSRQLFSQSPLKYMPPTKYMTGNIFKGYLQNGLFNLTSIMTNQGIQLLGMLTEAIHTPYMHDRYLAIENAKYVMNTARNLGDEIIFREDGIIQKRAEEVLTKAVELLEEIKRIGLFTALERGYFANIKRTIDGGKGLEGVINKCEDYYNPFEEIMKRENFQRDKGGSF
ncbi:beta-lysine 5,6-aminomutase alpha subunit [Anaerobranca californiensis DSM 14826]|uniref:Beta-lysine 5,6-aminomutase alpha subunit n=1 Tax=Anaerobranca californiensis DSM 14826 TaxID=1120989 RepID=A0A1M6M7M7_9FIRM|nr:lysine 5,6-aminomutase subunit alpha [Anaerobranca californiensis]SHJ79468.1 beta-lysine 5,6-aminomutase alpha subunit [Anaerobranca californiensis DSM 14826]